MLALLLESALRSALLAVIVGLGVKLLRVRSSHVEMTVWKVVLLASLAMPLLVHLLVPWTKVAIPLSSPPPQVTQPLLTGIEREPPTTTRQRLNNAAQPSITAESTPTTSLPDGTEPPAVAAAATFDWQAWMAGAYVLIAAFMVLRLLTGIALTLRLKRAAQPLREDWTGGCDVRVSHDVAMPVTFGSIILLPADCIEWSAVKRQAVMTHEQSHLEQRDFHLLLLASLNRAIFWFDPLSWWLVWRLAELAEIISDDAASEAVGDSTMYAEILLDVARSASPVVAGVAMARARTVRRRIERILAAFPRQPRITRRRQFLLSVGLLPPVAASTLTVVFGTAPISAQAVPAQQPTMPRIGFLNDLSPDQWPSPLSGFRRALTEAGYVEGQNVTFAYRWTEGHRDRLPALAAELARMRVDVIVASGDTAAALAAHAATSRIPIIFAIEDDPVRFGLAASLDRPGGNATGIYLETSAELSSTRQQILRQLAPGAMPVFFLLQLVDASSDASRTEPEVALTSLLAGVRVRTGGRITDDTKQLLRTDPETGLKQLQQEVGTPDDKDRVTPDTMRSLEIVSGPFLDRSRRLQMVALAASHQIPALYHWRAFVEAGGLISHGFNIEEVYRELGRYAANILHGQNPADLPVQKPAKFETIINLRTAAALDLNVSPALLARADKVIQ